MRFPDYFSSLDEPAQEDYAERAGTTANYIRTHLLAPIQRRKTPRRELFEALILASNGDVSRSELFEHFYPPDANSGQNAEVAA